MFFHLLSALFMDLLAETMFGVKSHDQSAFSCSLPELLLHSFFMPGILLIYRSRLLLLRIINQNYTVFRISVREIMSELEHS